MKERRAKKGSSIYWLEPVVGWNSHLLRWKRLGVEWGGSQFVPVIFVISVNCPTVDVKYVAGYLSLEVQGQVRKYKSRRA